MVNVLRFLDTAKSTCRPACCDNSKFFFCTKSNPISEVASHKPPKLTLCFFSALQSTHSKFRTMNKHHTLSLIACVAITAVAAHAAPFLAISENSEVFLIGTVGVRSDSNIFLTPKATSDTIYNFDVGAELKFGSRSTANGVFGASNSFSSFSSHSGLNSSLANVRFVTNFDDGKLKLGFKTSYIETDDNQADNVNGDFRNRRDILSAGTNVEVAATQKTSYGVGLDYNRTNYRRVGYADSNTAEIPINYYYEITPKVDLSLGYRYRDTKVSIGSDSSDSFYNVGARGQFTPKLNGQFNIGLNRRTLTGGSSESQLGVTSNFTYAYSEKTSMLFGVTNDFGTTGQGQQQKNLTLNASVQTNLSEQWNVSLGGSYRTLDYSARTDHYLDAQAGATYTYSSNIRITAAYSHRNNSSALAGAVFTGEVFSLQANFRY